MHDPQIQDFGQSQNSSYNQNNQQNQQFNQNQQFQNFPQNQQNQNFPPQQNPQQFPNYNMNPMFNFIPPMMSPEQQRRHFEMQKQQAREMGYLLKQQKEMMERLKADKEKRKKEREEGELIIFFKYKYDILPITFKANDLIAEALTKYLEESGKQNVKFRFRTKELKIDNSATFLYELEGMRSGEEIIVEDAQ